MTNDPNTHQSAEPPADVARLVEELLLIAAWHKLGGPTPKTTMSSVYSTCTEAAATLTTQAQRNAELEAENARLREALATMANSINIVGSHYDHAVQALDALVRSIKTQARAALGGSTGV